MATKKGDKYKASAKSVVSLWLSRMLASGGACVITCCEQLMKKVTKTAKVAQK